MKNKLFYIAILLFTLMACSDSFTDTPAVGALSDEALQNATGIELKLIGAYSALDGMRNNQGASDWTASGDNWWLDVLSDDAHKGSTDGDQATLYDVEVYNWSTGNDYILGKWLGLYAGVNRANAVIDLISKVTDGDFSAQLAEARFLRGHFNFELQKIYGRPSYISEENYAAIQFNQPNTGPIWDKIEADLAYAKDNLPASQADKGRPTKWTAQALLGKAQLHQGKWADAFTNLNNVVVSGPYSLIPEYGNNFRLSGDNSPESLFSIQYTADAGQSFNGNRGGTLNFGGPNGYCCGFYQPTQDLANAFQTDANGLPLLDTFNKSDIANDYGIESSAPFTKHAGNLDPRIDFTIGRRGIQFNGWGLMPGKDWIRANFADISGPYMGKKHIYHAGEDANVGTGGWGQQHSGINYHIIRFADVLLMAAEAAIETGDLTTGLDYVNRVRSRAKTSTPVKDANGAPAANYNVGLYPSFANQDYARKAVRMERRLELGMEGHRLFDIRRWGNGVQVMNDYFVNEARVIKSFAGKSTAYQSKHDMLPIPINAIDLSGGVLTQNPGF